MAGGAKGLPVLFPTLAAPLDAGLNPDLALCFKKLTKKDPITKTKVNVIFYWLLTNGELILLLFISNNEITLLYNNFSSY